MMMDRINTGAQKLDQADLENVAGGNSGSGELKGSFSSGNGTNLNLFVEWSAAGTPGNRLLTVNVSASSYSLNVQSLKNGVELQVNGVKHYANSAAVSYGSTTAKAMLPLATFTNIPVSGNSAYMIVTWHFNGEYSGQMINDLVATGMATL